jgi:hypothetical protein
VAYCCGYSKWNELDCGKQYVRVGEVYCWATVNGMNWTVGNIS